MPETLHDVFSTANASIDRASRIATTYIDRLSDDAAADVLLDLYEEAWRGASAIGTAAAWDRDDLRSYAQTQWSNAANVTSKAIAVRDAYQAIADLIETLFPQDGNGYLLFIKLLNGQRVIRVLPSGSLNDLRSLLNTLLSVSA